MNRTQGKFSTAPDRREGYGPRQRSAAATAKLAATRPQVAFNIATQAGGTAYVSWADGPSRCERVVKCFARVIVTRSSVTA